MIATNIYFTNLETLEEDSTQFDTTDRKELAELWWDFCIENGIITGTEEEDIGDE